MGLRRVFVLLLVLSGSIGSNSWAQTVPASGNTCITTYTGSFNGNVTVSAGQLCVFSGGRVAGNVTVNAGGSLILDHAMVTGNV
jgi:hypothetical protein